MLLSCIAQCVAELFACLQETFTGSNYGHVAFVFNSLWPDKTTERLDDILIFESFASHHGNPVPDAIKGEVMDGPLDQRSLHRHRSVCATRIQLLPRNFGLLEI